MGLNAELSVVALVKFNVWDSRNEMEMLKNGELTVLLLRDGIHPAWALLSL